MKVSRIYPYNKTKGETADEQMKRLGKNLIKGEDLNLVVGSRAVKGSEKSELVKLNIAKILTK